ncbi:MAG: hypothetical protein KF796_04275 [Ramlibacter sp.]|nr:hypothetical protein [Ramlibacter sp.]
MHRFLSLLLLPVLWGLAGCSPALNWREVRVEPTALMALLPCKPDTGSRTVPFAGRETTLHMVGCEAGGATFAIAFAQIDDAAQAPDVLARWKAATLANMHAASSTGLPMAIAGADSAVPPQRVSASGARADGSAVQSQAVYFARGREVFQAVIYAQRALPDGSDTFFSNLRFP